MNHREEPATVTGAGREQSAPGVMFSVLMSVYRGEKAEFLDAAFWSLRASTVALPEVVLVQDGPLPDALHEIIARHEAALNLRRVALAENVGLGPALTEGLKQCRHGWIARFDTDDLIVPDRFARQLELIESVPEVDLFGGWIWEFDADPATDEGRLRRVPESHEAILAYAKRRNPFNHMTVMFRRDLALSLGGYRNEHLYEDYALWVRMILAGARTANLPAVLVNARAGAGMYARRGGFGYAAGEFRAQWAFYKSGFIALPRLALNLASRLPIRILPHRFRQFLYERVLRARKRH
ncbi:glycosyltransferase [Achromobacter sp. NPDC058515]|uniref:glycosyltransferase n=1 Tax=Achromobacter sp. NPDC058515 TaxID=3346533 RepID=UPI0036563DDB